MKKFDEFINEEIGGYCTKCNNPNGCTCPIVENNITNDIEDDLGEMSPEEGIDYLKNIIEFCNSEINKLDK